MLVALGALFEALTSLPWWIYPVFLLVLVAKPLSRGAKRFLGGGM